MSDEEYGPPLPPGFQKPSSKDSSSETEDLNGQSLTRSKNPKTDTPDDNDNVSDSLMRPASPSSQHLGKSDRNLCDKEIGPSLPPSLNSGRNANCGERSKSNIIGPSAPPGLDLQSQTKGDNSQPFKRNVGPELPAGWKSHSDERVGPSLIGPVMPARFGPVTRSDTDSDSDNIGPLPAEMVKEKDLGITASEFEKRAQKMKDKLTGKNESEKFVPETRDSWMTELPPETGKSFGLTSRTFRTHGSTSEGGDRSVWTDTPADRERKEKGKAVDGDRKRHHGDDRHEKHGKHRHKDKKLAKEIEKYNKSKRSESLMEMHQKKRKKEKKKEKKAMSQPKERRPFDRDADLQVNKFDEAQRQSIIKRSQQLNTRFGHGSTESSFL